MHKSQQITLEGVSLSIMPKVRTTDGHLMDWNREAIVKQLLKETKLSEQFYKASGISEEEAKEIAKETERRIRWMDVKFLSGPLVREIMNVILLERHHLEWRNICTRVGTPVYDAHLIDVGSGFEANENANLQENAETSHKKKADKISKEQYLLLIPPYLADRHLTGDLHIHDLEYFGTRPFCQDWDLRYFFYYGLMPDGTGTRSSVAGPARKAEVAILHAVKALGSAQTNFAGGQGFYNFLTFIAPYFENHSKEEIYQLMQMFVYEMTQMMVARGGQVVFSSVQLSPGVPGLWRDMPVVYKGKIWNGEQAPLRTYGEFEREVRLGFEALMKVMQAGDYWGKPFNFPKPEISIEPDFIEEDEEFNAANPDMPSYRDLYLLTFELAAKYGTPYYDNQLPAYRGAGKGISCYQCLAADELVPLMEIDGQIQVRRIGDIFTEADDNDKEVDPYGVEFVKLRGHTPSINLETLEASLKEFRGVMRRRYRGRLLNIILVSGRRIRVTPDHPVFVLENGAFSDKSARDLNIGDYLPVLKDT
ncbi:MAG: anaerobic ribonucleoside-triphosphate reductase, partial [Methanotrichaceae archaeon]